jgi:hypothetical protein
MSKIWIHKRKESSYPFVWAFIAIGVFCPPSPSRGEGGPYAKVEVNQGIPPTKNKEVTFQVTPLQNLIINEEAPWTLAVTGMGVKLVRDKLKKEDYNAKIPGFILSLVELPKAPSELSYELTAFICTKDKGRCFREVLKGKVEVKP